MKYINEITREFGIEHHTLRNWEEKGYLGVVERDFTHGRMYSEEQIERIKTIQQTVLKQKEQGLKRTDFKEVERTLMDKFGGVVEVRPQSIPASPEMLTNLLIRLEKQDKENQEMRHLILELTKITKELPKPLEPAMTKDQADELLTRFTEQEKEKKEIENEMKLLKDKLDIAVEYIQNQEIKGKSSIWKRIFR